MPCKAPPVLKWLNMTKKDFIMSSVNLNTKDLENVSFLAGEIGKYLESDEAKNLSVEDKAKADELLKLFNSLIEENQQLEKQTETKVTTQEITVSATAVAELMAKILAMLSEMNRENMQSSFEAKMDKAALIQESAEEMTKKAEELKNAAITNICVGLVSSFVAASFSVGGSFADKITVKAIGEGLSNMVGVTNKQLDTLKDANAAEADAQVKELEAYQAKKEAVAEYLDNLTKDFSSTIEQIVQSLKSISDAETQARRHLAG